MSGKGGLYGFLKKHFGEHCSIIGLKIAAAVGLCLVVSVLGYMLFRGQEVPTDIYGLLASPSLWGAALGSFFIVMAFLSRVVILPLKRFELHISELEQGKAKAPLDIESNDEIGFLAERFNKLQKIVSDKMEEKDVHLTTLHDFTNAASGTFDIPSLMDHFFNILKTAVQFDAGAYAITLKNQVEGRIYSLSDRLDETGDQGSNQLAELVLARGAAYCGEMRGKASVVDVVRLVGGGRGRAKTGDLTSLIDLPIVFRGAPIGVVALFSHSGEAAEPASCSRVFAAMVQHANSVIEKLLSHIFAEEAELSNILSSMSEGVYMIDKSGQVVSVNKKGKELLTLFCDYQLECVSRPHEPGMGICPGKHESCGFANIIKKVRNYGPDFEDGVCTEEIGNKAGMVFQVSVSGLRTNENRTKGFVVTVKDVTEERMIQKRLFLSSKLAALGEMAAGIAHEVNNPLQVILANIELLEGDVAAKGVKKISNIRDAVDRVKGIVRDLLIFAREQTTESEDVDINKVVEKACDILSRQLELANVALKADLHGKPLMVRCNKNLFQQVIINLLQNAKDAIEESGAGGTLRVRTAQLTSDALLVEVSDNGPGIPARILGKIFDPFFTTKDVGKGTGLGLSVSRRIIENIGGNISVASSPEGGTSFRITLNFSNAEVIGKGAERPQRDGSSLINKSVLIVDDEAGVVKALKECLGPRTGSIDGASNGKEAMDKLMLRDYDIILLDIKMPLMNGIELYRNLYTSRPHLAKRIIFLTGDTDNAATESFLKLTGCMRLGKPFTLKELQDTMCRHELVAE